MKSSTDEKNPRRRFLRNVLAIPALGSAGAMTASALYARENLSIPAHDEKRALKLSLNAFSFNRQLLDGSMTLNDLLEFCAKAGLMAVDITGYYFRGYPQVPADEVIYDVKRKAFSLGVEICGTGVRNDFTFQDPVKRRENVQLVKDWIEVSRKLGGQTIRIFSGTQKPAGYPRDQILEWMLADIRECVDYGKAHGVVVALQNHDDFIKTAADTIEIMEAVKSPWYGLMLDIGSYRTADPYEEIAQTIRYAVTWQIKEKVFVKGKEAEVDANRLMTLIRNSDFRGYLPLETLGEGDPRTKVIALYKKFSDALSRS